jgi:Uma2 family endonuclease
MKAIAKWSVDEYHAMILAGILVERRVELLAGDIIEMSPETPIHYNTVKRGAKYLESLLDNRAEIRFNGPITLENSEPEPDIAIVRLPGDRYNTRHPYPEDIFSIIEVANTSLQKDLEEKKILYATAGIPEYWVWNLRDRSLVIFREPIDRDYTHRREITSGEIRCLAFPEIPIDLDSLFPV